MRIELMTSSLPRKRSTPELHRPKKRAEDEVRTRDLQLGRLPLYQLSYSRFFPDFFFLIVGGGGFEPPKAMPTDLQSAPFDRSGIPPKIKKRADRRIRTADRLITNQLLWPTELYRQNSSLIRDKLFPYRTIRLLIALKNRVANLRNFILLNKMFFVFF